jgi:ABC-type antimicrobial peptide transport system permease subunit
MTDERGEPVSLRIVGTLSESIFQSELLISEANFLRLFPSRAGFSYFLVDAPDGGAEEVATTLEEGLAPFGFDAVSTATRLAGYLVVQNTYLSTFQMLGGLGLLLGTIGLGIVLVRNVIERRGELATLRAFGFRRSFLGRMVMAENAFLLLLGLAIGTLSALLAISPRYLLGAVEVPWGSLLPTLGAVLVVGMLASIVAVAGALRVPLLPALKRD